MLRRFLLHTGHDYLKFTWHGHPLDKLGAGSGRVFMGWQPMTHRIVSILQVLSYNIKN